MSAVLPRYLRRRVGMQTLGLLFVLTALMQVLELLDVTTDILDRGLGLRGLAYYAWLRTPSEIVLALPLAALLGAMSALYGLARSGEITAIRCAGVSLRQVLVQLLPVPLLLALLQFALGETLVPRTETKLKSWWDATAPQEETPEIRWARTEDGPVSFDHTTPDGRELRHVRIYLRGEDGLFATRMTATSAQWSGKSWQLDGVEELHVADNQVQRSKETSRIWETNLRPDDVLRLDVMQPHLSSMMLIDVIVGERVGAQPRSYYETVLYRTFTAPLGAFVMLLLAMPAARAVTRTGGGGRLLIALGLGLGFMLFDGILSAMGTSGRMPALLAALVAPLLFAAIGFFQLRACDRT